MMKRVKVIYLIGLTVLMPLANARAVDGVASQFGLKLGYAGNSATHLWSIYTYGKRTPAFPNFNALTIGSDVDYGPGQVTGDVAMAGPGATLLFTGFGSLTGDVYLKPTGTVTQSTTSTWMGVEKISTATTRSLSQGSAKLRSVSNHAAKLAPTSGMPITIADNTVATWTFNIGMTGANVTTGPNRLYFVPAAKIGKLTLKLTDFVLAGGSTVTFNGESGQAAVVNVSNNFNLSGASKVLLTGGLTPSDILFNVRGTNAGGLPFEISGGSQFNGTLLAYNNKHPKIQRTLLIADPNTLVTGEILANQVNVSGGAKVQKPPVASQY
jgi:hypothetical protein